MTDIRLNQLRDWCHTQLAQLEQLEQPHDAANPAPLEAVSGDASFRRYFRVRGDGWHYIAVDAPPQNENSAPFIHIAKLFATAGVHTPAVIATDAKAGFMLLEDLGDALYLPALLACQTEANHDEASTLYQQAIDALLRIQTGVPGESLNPYSREELRSELELFPEWFCHALLKVTPNKSERRMLDEVFTFLEDAALAQPQVAVHRDYHSRNLFLPVADTGMPGIIDFQDAVTGAYTYDLVSLLRDCYIRWDESLMWHWAEYYFKQATALKIVPPARATEFRRDFDLMGLQRHLKVLGIFARLHIRDNKPDYLADMPLVMNYFLDVARRHALSQPPQPQLQALLSWFEETLLPATHPHFKHLTEN
ncbi:MAG: aminoglycoside phosphotransferase family protein [Pseudohongiellaceae bacterium]